MTVEYSNAVRPESLTYGNPGERRDVSPPVRFLPLRWLVPAASFTILFAVGLSIALPVVRQYFAIRQIEALGGGVELLPADPDWLQHWIGPEWTRSLGEVELIYFSPDKRTFQSRFKGFLCGPPPWTTGTTIENSTLSIVTQFPRIKRLALNWTNVSDSGIAHLSGLAQLEALQLDGTDVSDTSVTILAGLSQLKFLSIRDTKISTAGFDELRRALPGCRVVGSQF